MSRLHGAIVAATAAAIVAATGCDDDHTDCTGIMQYVCLSVCLL